MLHVLLLQFEPRLVLLTHCTVLFFIPCYVIPQCAAVQRRVRTMPLGSSEGDEGAGGSAVDDKLYSRQLYVMGHEAQVSPVILVCWYWSYDINIHSI